MNIARTLVAGMLLLGAGQGLALGGMIEVSVYDRTEARRLPVHWHQGRAWIAGRPGNEYQVTLRNRLGEDLLAVVSVDGINVITGEGADPAQSGYVLGARGTLEVQGWRRSLAQTAAFYFTALPDSYAARTGRPEHVGVIGVALFRRKPAVPPAPIARGEPRADGAHGGARAAESDSRLGTGHGRHETSHAYYTTFERASSAPAQLVTLYYDSHANLVARGVIREPLPVAPLPLPRPFPGFVPDPRG